MSKTSPVPFRLIKVNTEEFATFPDVEQIEGEIDLQTGISYSIDDKGHAVKCVARFQYECADKVFILLQASCEFEIELKTWNKWHSKKEELVTIPQNFSSHLAVITIGTARGIFHAKTEHTVFNKYLIPTINVTNFVKEDIVINIK